VEKQFCFDSNPACTIWDNMWTSRTIGQELEACEIESPPRDLFLSYIPRDGRIIDAGCGFGKWVIYLHRRGHNILGIDNNDLAVSKLKEFDPTLQVEKGDILATGYPDHSFDAYISMGVVEHFEEGPQLALKEASRILKPGGLIFVSVPTVNVLRLVVRQPMRNVLHGLLGMPGRLIALAGRFARRQPALTEPEGTRRDHTKYRHFLEYRYSKREMEAFLREAGFEIVETIPHDFYGSRDHAVGLVLDFPFLGVRGAANFRLNFFGKIVSRALNGVSPWIACSSVLCVGRSRKE
jgi:SAM-dependent methyltransferase